MWVELYRLPVTQTLKELGITGVVAPTSQFVTNPDLVSMRAFEVVYQRLKPASTGGTPGGLHGDNLVATKAVGGGRSVTLSTSNPTTVFDSADLTLQATVQDSGNFQEVNVPVTLKIKVAGKTVLTRHKTIASIQAAQRLTVSFGNLQLPPDAFGHQATVTVQIGGVPGEKNLANNRAAYPVFFRLSQ